MAGAFWQDENRGMELVEDSFHLLFRLNGGEFHVVVEAARCDQLKDVVCGQLALFAPPCHQQREHKAGAR